MKKNISINLFGTLYNIDEDAYNLLENYLQSMQRYFSRQEGGDEIADDIEHRVAELLWQKKEEGMEAVNIDIVKNIITTIGKAEEIGEGCDTQTDREEGNTSEGTQDKGETRGNGGENAQDGNGADSFEETITRFAKETGRFARDTYDKGCQHVNTHHFYRRNDDKVLGGVCSGLALYFDGVNVLLWRLGAVMTTIILSFVGIGIVIPVLYLLLWALAPLAATPEDRLRMQGKDITPENITQQVMDESTHTAVPQNNSKVASGCLKTILIALGVFLLIPLFSSLIAIIVVLFLAISIITGIGTAYFGNASAFPEFWSFVEACHTPFITSLVCGVLLIAIPIYSVIRLIRRSGKKMGAGMVLTLVIGWFVTLALCISSIVATCFKGSEWNRTKHMAHQIERNIGRLNEIGWTLEMNKNLSPGMADERTGYAHLPKYAIELEMDDEDSICYDARLVKKVTLKEGGYTLMALTENGQEGLNYTLRYKDNGEDKEAVIRTAEGGRYLSDIPFEETENIRMFNKPDSLGWEYYAEQQETWVYQETDIPHADAGTYTLVIEATNCTADSKIRDVKVVEKKAVTNKRRS